MTDLKKGIRPLFRDHVFAGRSLLFLEETESTNLLCLENPELLSFGGLVVFCQKQTRGIGRKSRRWEQGKSGHLFSSFVIHPDTDLIHLATITLFTGLAVFKAIASLGAKDLSIKWPNDILLKERKVSGILCQSRQVGDRWAVVAGIGVNILGSSKQFTEELRTKATTLNEQGIFVEPVNLLKKISLELEDILVKAHKGQTPALINEWKNCALCIGRKISFEQRGIYRKGVIKEIDHVGRLIVTDRKGVLYLVESGQIEYEYPCTDLP